MDYKQQMQVYTVISDMQIYEIAGRAVQKRELVQQTNELTKLLLARIITLL